VVLSQEILNWKRDGTYINAFGMKIFTTELNKGNNKKYRDDETLLILHGFPTSCFDFRSVGKQMLESDTISRIILFDFPGYGLSDKPWNYSYSLMEQAEVTFEVWRQLNVSGGHLMAHDMGDSVATEILSRRERKLLPSWFNDFKSVTFNNGGMQLEFVSYRISQILLRIKAVAKFFSSFMSESLFTKQIQSILENENSINQEIHYMWELVLYNNGHLRTPQVIQYIDDRYRFEGRWISTLKSIDLPVHLLWGRADKVAPPQIAEKLQTEIPGVKTTWMTCGHFCMLESPERWTENVLKFFKELK